MKASAVAHPNIALVKYWGKRDLEYNLPAAGSLSMTLGGLSTRTSVEFGAGIDADSLELDGKPVESGAKLARVSGFLDLVRDQAGISERARVVSTNDFPTGAGLASSASGFAALALAATGAAGLELDPTELSILARRGSGSAARSIFGGFVEMSDGSAQKSRPDRGIHTVSESMLDPPSVASQAAFARQIAPGEHWDLRCIIAVTSAGEKEVGSTEGMTRTQETSPYYAQWVDSVAPDIERARAAVAARDFDALAGVAEASCLRMHASAMAAEPGIVYWNATTVALMHAVRRARAGGLPVFFTIDAGPQVKVFCPADARAECRALIEATDGVRRVLEAHPGEGARLV
jgi:diphosphomevalonate decarboxylase